MRGQSLSHGTSTLWAACVEFPPTSVRSSPESSDFDGLSLKPSASAALRWRDVAQARGAEIVCERFQSAPPMRKKESQPPNVLCMEMYCAQPSH